MATERPAPRSCCTTTASPVPTSICVSRRTACCAAGRCHAGCPTTPADNRLAVAVEDHDLEHLTYEDADKSIADEGTWEEHDRNEKRLVFTLHGRGGARRYALIRTDRDWLLHLTQEPVLTAGPEVPMVSAIVSKVS